VLGSGIIGANVGCVESIKLLWKLLMSVEIDVFAKIRIRSIVTGHRSGESAMVNVMGLVVVL